MKFIESDYLPFSPGELPPGPWLVLAPHPDDETYGMGGSIRRAAIAGLIVHVLVLTDGALGGPDPAGLVTRREAEAREAAGILGISDIQFWREPDRGLEPSDHLAQRVAKLLVDLGIRSLFFPSLTEPHPDHRATAVIGWEACRLAAFTASPIAYEISSHGPINLLLDVTQSIADKEAAMAVYSSQEAERPYARRVLAHNIARTWSLADDVLFAESFLAIRPLDLPLAEVATSCFALYPSGLAWDGRQRDATNSPSDPPREEPPSQVGHGVSPARSDPPDVAITRPSAIAFPSHILPSNPGTTPPFTGHETAARPDDHQAPRVCLLIFHPSDSPGGAERITRSLGRLHDRDRMRIVLVASPLLFNHHDADLFLPLFDLGLSNGFSTLIRAYRDARTLTQVARREGCTVALGMLHYGALVVALMRFTSRFQIAAISSPRTPSRLGIEFHVGHTGWQAFTWRGIVRFFCRFATRVLVASEGLKEECVKVYGSVPTKVLVIPNGVDTARLQRIHNASPPKPESQAMIHIITFGRLAPEKDIDTLLAAFHIARQKIQARLTIIGDGPERQRLEELAKGLDLSDQVAFLGFHPDPFAMIKGADIFVHTARFEGFGNAILEAMACGIAVIATDCDFGPREIIAEGINGNLVPPRDPQRLAETLIALGQDPARREAFIRQGYATLAQYREEDMVHAYEKAILNLHAQA